MEDAIRIVDDNIEATKAWNGPKRRAAGQGRSRWRTRMRVDEIRPKIADDLRVALADFVVDGGAVVAPPSTWNVTARAPR